MTVIIYQYNKSNKEYVELFDTVKEFKLYLADFLKKAEQDLIKNKALDDGLILSPYTIDKAPFKKMLETFKEITSNEVEII